MKEKKKILFLILLLFFVIPTKLRAFEALGGEITWKCAGGNSFVFQLVLYRDCNSADIISLSENLKVWNHSLVTDITLNFVSKSEISPSCTQNSTSLPALSCGTGNNAGNGLGAVEKYIFTSNPVQLSGIPPPEGWIFTYETSARKASISNIQNPASKGMTLVAKMFQISKVQNTCLDNSPQFLENPYLIVCSGTPYLYMPNVSDEDLDSLSFSLVSPLDNMSAGVFNPPTNPSLTAFTNGYSFSSPTPSTSANGANVNFSIDPFYGDLSFSSVISGEFVVKFLVSSYRNGQKIAENEREMVVFVKNCTGTNQAPIINAPIEFGSSYFASFNAGSLVNFTVTSTDPEFLQDGTSPQRNNSTISSIVLASKQTASGVQGSSNAISWQTGCSMLKNSFGNEYARVLYNFVIKVEDDYCQIPRSSYQRVQIELTTNPQVATANIECIQTLANGDLQITVGQTTDFVAYELHSVQDGLIQAFTNADAPNLVIPNNGTAKDYFIKTLTGTPCEVALSSDTISNIVLNLFNPADGTVTLSWNAPFSARSNGFPYSYEVFREYPTGTFTSLGTTAFDNRSFLDTIDICSAIINYFVVLQDVNCQHQSNSIGGLLSDRIAPFAPTITSVTIDTLTGFATIIWSKPPNDDIEGYIIYFNNVEFDTVFGMNNTSYTYQVANNTSVLNFSVAAFDFCNSQFNPLFKQTSGRSIPHTTMFLKQKYEVCSKTITLSWSTYIGWSGIEYFEIFGREESGPWISFGQTNDQFFDISLKEFVNYSFVVQAKDSLSSNFSFSNKVTLFTTSTSKPAFNYLRVATVSDQQILVKYDLDVTSGVSELVLERRIPGENFKEIQRKSAVAQNVFIDEEVDVANQSYYYQVKIIDSCGNVGATSNFARTILLEVKTDDIRQRNFLTWNKYEGFNGSVLNYNLYRGVEGSFGTLPYATLSPNETFYEDTLMSNLSFNGQICYYIEAVEAINIFSYREVSYSNTVCPVFKPIIYLANTFTPNGDAFNQTYKPSVDLIDINEYHFTIFDRWGQVIFKTNQIDEAWDGTIKSSGQTAPVGTYAVVIQVRDGNNQEIVKRGFVNLLR